jgi:hypothetical protein
VCAAILAELAPEDVAAIRAALPALEQAAHTLPT